MRVSRDRGRGGRRGRGPGLAAETHTSGGHQHPCQRQPPGPPQDCSHDPAPSRPGIPMSRASQLRGLLREALPL